LWIKVSSVIQTLSVAHIKGKMSILPIKHVLKYWSNKVILIYCWLLRRVLIMYTP
jgi:hypothetical protein